MIKSLIAHLFFILTAVFLSGPLVASAGFFGDTETSPQQQFSASELELQTSLEQRTFQLGEQQSEQTTQLMVDVSALSIDSTFDIAVTEVAGNGDFCSDLRLELVGGTASSSGSLSSFTSPESEIFGSFDLTISLDGTGSQVDGQTCQATLAVTTWQANMSKTSAGYRDVVEYQLTIIRDDTVEAAVMQKKPASQALTDLSIQSATSSLETENASTGTDETAPASGASETTEETGSVESTASSSESQSDTVPTTAATSSSPSSETVSETTKATTTDSQIVDTKPVPEESDQAIEEKKEDSDTAEEGETKKEQTGPSSEESEEAAESDDVEPVMKEPETVEEPEAIEESAE